MSNKIISLIDGSLGGGNTSHLFDIIEQKIGNAGAGTNRFALIDNKFDINLFNRLKYADAWIIGTGTYWDSWGHPLQEFLEWITPWEGHDDILGKPVGIVVTAHSVGAKGIVSRLQGALSSMGILIPPMSGLVISMASELAIKASKDTWMENELWNIDDLDIMIHNIILASQVKEHWKTWKTGGEDSCSKVWIKT